MNTVSVITAVVFAVGAVLVYGGLSAAGKPVPSFPRFLAIVCVIAGLIDSIHAVFVFVKTGVWPAPFFLEGPISTARYS